MLQQRRYWLIVCICLVLILGIHQIAVYADAPNGQTTYRVNVRSRSSQDSDIIAIFPANTPLNVTNRSDDSKWLLATNTTTMLRGWVNARYVQLNAGLQVAALPVSSDVASAATSVPDGQTPQPTPTSSLMATAYAPPEIPSEVMKAAHLKAPILPKIDGAMHASMKRIFARGQQ